MTNHTPNPAADSPTQPGPDDHRQALATLVLDPSATGDQSAQLDRIFATDIQLGSRFVARTIAQGDDPRQTGRALAATARSLLPQPADQATLNDAEQALTQTAEHVVDAIRQLDTDNDLEDVDQTLEQARQLLEQFGIGIPASAQLRPLFDFAVQLTNAGTGVGIQLYDDGQRITEDQKNTLEASSLTISLNSLLNYIDPDSPTLLADAATAVRDALREHTSQLTAVVHTVTPNDGTAGQPDGRNWKVDQHTTAGTCGRCHIPLSDQPLHEKLCGPCTDDTYRTLKTDQVTFADLDSQMQLVDDTLGNPGCDQCGTRHADLHTDSRTFWCLPCLLDHFTDHMPLGAPTPRHADGRYTVTLNDDIGHTEDNVSWDDLPLPLQHAYRRDPGRTEVTVEPLWDDEPDSRGRAHLHTDTPSSSTEPPELPELSGRARDHLIDTITTLADVSRRQAGRAADNLQLLNELTHSRLLAATAHDLADPDPADPRIVAHLLAAHQPDLDVSARNNTLVVGDPNSSRQVTVRHTKELGWDTVDVGHTDSCRTRQQPTGVPADCSDPVVVQRAIQQLLHPDTTN